MSPTSLRIWKKLSRNVTSLTEGSTRRSQQTLTVHLGLTSFSASGSNSPQGPVPRQPCKPKGHCLKVIIGREVDDFVTQGHHLPSDPVDDAVDSGAWYPKHSRDHPFTRRITEREADQAGGVQVGDEETGTGVQARAGRDRGRLVRRSPESGVRDRRQTMEEGVSEVLSSVVQDVDLVVSSNSGAQILQELLSVPWLSALLKIYESLLQFKRLRPTPLLPYSAGLSHEIMCAMSKIQRPSSEARELFRLLCSPHVKALLRSHDTVAQQDFDPVLEPLPDDLPDDEEAVRIVCLVKNNQPLGATIKRDEKNGQIYIARVIHGGLADRSGLLNAGDVLLEVNGNSVAGLDPEQVIKMLVKSRGTILFKVIPNSSQNCSSQKSVYMRAMVDYCPLEDSSIPCPAAGVGFSRADILEVVDQSDGQWWQARRLPSSGSCAGLIPSASNLKSKQRELWWCQPLQSHTCIKPLTSARVMNESSSGSEKDQTQIDDQNVAADEGDADEMDKLYIAGFRRSFRFWRRSSLRRRRQSCSSCCPGNSALATPYEEVTLYQRPLQDMHRLIVLVGASGVGVNELRKRLIRINPLIFQGPVPHTTRPMRAEEQTGREYVFVSREQFDHMISNHRFVEYGEHRGHLYGTSFDAIEEVLQQGRICVIDVEPRSVQSLRTKTLKPFVIFVKVPDSHKLRETRRKAHVLTKHGYNRTFTEDDFVELEETSKLIELKYRQFFDSVLVNGDLNQSCLQLCSLVQRAQDQDNWVPVSWTREDL
ncbi:MAGUK p55 subfamily member 4-like [Periophthalmus magnuspinnatus]|uniref:MAGUK p55 subfamily member 4-like n=1 Tax=Periophthalmus magnuspinnatus TaxID=409849 RepID=UPI00145C17B8|nr:MAGUK p55 subfamily member 4-like [Periophthalmus magnuspinnatus]